MASKPRQLENGTWQWTIKNRYLRELTGLAATWVTAPAHQLTEGQARVDEIESKLKLGIVPDEIAQKKQRGGDRVSNAALAAKAIKSDVADPNIAMARLHQIVGAYETSGRRISDSDKKIHSLLIEESGNP